MTRIRSLLRRTSDVHEIAFGTVLALLAVTSGLAAYHAAVAFFG